jgi:hypothetical protein
MPRKTSTTKPNPKPLHDQIPTPKTPSILEHELLGTTVIFDETEVGVGRQVYYLYSETSNQQEALKEFRRRFFKRAPADHWTWIVRGLSLHSGRYWPKSLAKFPSPPNVLEAHWLG